MITLNNLRYDRLKYGGIYWAPETLLESLVAEVEDLHKLLKKKQTELDELKNEVKIYRTACDHQPNETIPKSSDAR